MARLGARPSRFLLTVNIARQRMLSFKQDAPLMCSTEAHRYRCLREYVISTSRFGIGQVEGSNQTPLGLHRVARKIGGGFPIGTVFKSRRPTGLTWQGQPDGTIVHRILWLEGLEPGFNRGGRVDTFRRYIYIHGFGDEMTLGRPQSHGCIHLAASDLLPLFDRLPVGTLVWIAER
jgi:lipoprotein-anchoring transpeptidase ErfK/SrfK